MLRKITAVPANQTKTQEPESQEKKSSGFYAGKISRAKSIAYVGEAKDSAFQNILKFRSPNAQVLYIHPSFSTITEASKLYQSENQFVFCHEELTKLSLPRGSFDFLWIRKTLEFEPDPRAAFDCLTDHLISGGELLVEEYDRRLLNHYPVPIHIESQLHEIEDKAEKAKRWTPKIGSELFSFASEDGFNNIKTEIHPQAYSGERISSDELQMFEQWFCQMQAAQKEQIITLSFDLSVFKREFLSFIENPQRFSYNSLMRLSARKD